jgi:hypothetical protein
VQHALRAFTPNDAENLRKTVKTYPVSDFYQIDKVLTSLGTGQALITVLNDKGIPTEVVATHLVPARAVMGPCSPELYTKISRESDFYSKYRERIEGRTAAEILDEKQNLLEQQQVAEKARLEAQKEAEKQAKANVTPRSRRQTPLEAAQSQASRTLAREGVKFLSKLANGILSSFLKKK